MPITTIYENAKTTHNKKCNNHIKSLIMPITTIIWKCKKPNNTTTTTTTGKLPVAPSLEIVEAAVLIADISGFKNKYLIFQNVNLKIYFGTTSRQFIL